MKRSPLVILFITVVIDLLGFGIVLPLLPLYVREFGGGPFTSSLLSTCFSIMQFVFAPFWGRASDRWGRRPFILASLLGSALSFLVFGLAGSLWVLFAARIIAGITTAASLPTAQAYISDVTAPENRSRGMAIIGIAFGIGFSLGPWIGSALSKHGLAAPPLFVAGLSFVNFVWSYFSLPESHKPTEQADTRRKIQILDTRAYSRAFKEPVLRSLLTVFSIGTFSFALMEATFTWLVLMRFIEPHHAMNATKHAIEQQTAHTVGPMFAVVGITIFITQGLMMSPLARFAGDRPKVSIGSLLTAFALLEIGLSPTVWLVTLFSGIMAFGNGLMTPSLNSLISRQARSDERGAIIGVQHSLGSLARIVGPPIGTTVLERFSTTAPYVMASGLMAVAFALSVVLRLHQDKDEEIPNPAYH